MQTVRFGLMYCLGAFKGIHRVRRVEYIMPMQKFIKEHRAEIDAAILRVCPNCTRHNDEERRLWILNDEGLYNWARSEGVKI
jgi:Leu/Phe-tRNA-protein transferase